MWARHIITEDDRLEFLSWKAFMNLTESRNRLLQSGLKISINIEYRIIGIKFVQPINSKLFDQNTEWPFANGKSLGLVAKIHLFYWSKFLI